MPYVDSALAYTKGKGLFIEFFHIPSGRAVAFKPYLDEFTDSYDADWNEESVYGRNDPLKTFKNTKREITLAWSVIAASNREAISNLAKCSLLFEMQYPTYSSDENTASSITAPPLFKIKFANLVQDVSTKGGNAETSGLVCTMSGFKYSPDVTQGFFDPGKGQLYPQTIKLTCTCTILHTHDLGWDRDQFRTRGFPYSLNPLPPDFFEKWAKKASDCKQQSFSKDIRDSEAMQHYLDSNFSHRQGGSVFDADTETSSTWDQ